MRKKESHTHHERRESIGEEFAEHTCTIGTRTPDERVKKFTYTGHCRD